MPDVLSPSAGDIFRVSTLESDIHLLISSQALPGSGSKLHFKMSLKMLLVSHR
jgi:hypothetical protein